MTSTTVPTLPIDLLDAHPDHPRVVEREDVVLGILAELGDVFPLEHAVLVRKLGDRYQIISGHLRVAAARRKGLREIPAHIAELDDDAAFMQLVGANRQGELDPLDIGRHALRATRKGCGGRGRKGGVSAYASQLGYDESFVRMARRAAEVAEQTPELAPRFRKRAKHLAAVHRAHRSLWSLLARLMLDHKWSAERPQRECGHYGPAVRQELCLPPRPARPHRQRPDTQAGDHRTGRGAVGAPPEAGGTGAGVHVL